MGLWPFGLGPKAWDKRSLALGLGQAFAKRSLALGLGQAFGKRSLDLIHQIHMC